MESPPKPDPVPGFTLLGALAYVTDLFAWPLRTSHYVELVNPLWTTHNLQARIVDVWDETRDSRTLTLRPGLNWRGHPRRRHALHPHLYHFITARTRRWLLHYYREGH